MKKARACFADGGQISKADQLIAEMNAKYGVSGNAPAPTPVVQQPAPQPQPIQQPQQRGLVGNAIQLFGGRAKQIDKAAGYANGGLIGNAAQYWQDDNAKFEQASPNIGQRILRGINPITGFGSAMGAMKSAAEQGSIPGMGMALIQAIPAAGMMRAMPAVGAVKASVAPSVARTAVATGGGATANAIADDVQQRTAYRNGGKIQGSGTPTSDSIDAQVNETGEPIKVSTKERIVSHEQDQLLQRLAKAMGFESVDAFFEAGTGKPVGPTIKAGKRAAANGLLPEEEQKRIQAFGPVPPTLGTGLNGMTRTNPDTTFVTGSAPGIAPPPQSGRDASGIITADSAKAATAEPMQRSGGIAGGIDMAGVNGILARENKARGEMIDSMVRANGGNGVAILPDTSAQPASQGLALSDIQSAMKSAGTRTERAAYGQALNTALNNQVQSRGQDMNYAATVAGHGITARGQDMNNERAIGHDQVIMRGQDVNAQTDAARVGLEGKRLGLAQTAEERAADRWNVERPGIVAQAKDSDAVRSARQGLIDAVASGDQKAIERARTIAVAAGINFDKSADSFDFKTGPMGNVAVQKLPDGRTSITTFGIDGKPRPSVTIPAPMAQQSAGSKRVGNSPHDEGTQLVGKDGKNYVVRNGQAVMVQ